MCTKRKRRAGRIRWPKEGLSSYRELDYLLRKNGFEGLPPMYTLETGFDIERAKEMLEKLGLEIEFIF